MFFFSANKRKNWLLKNGLSLQYWMIVCVCVLAFIHLENKWIVWNWIEHTAGTNSIYDGWIGPTMPVFMSWERYRNFQRSFVFFFFTLFCMWKYGEIDLFVGNIFKFSSVFATGELSIVTIGLDFYFIFFSFFFALNERNVPYSNIIIYSNRFEIELHFKQFSNWFWWMLSNFVARLALFSLHKIWKLVHWRQAIYSSVKVHWNSFFFLLSNGQ